MPEMTLPEFFRLFGRTPDQARWLALAESEEYLAMISYLVERPSIRNRRMI